jgi:hypothetical protein
MKWIFNKNKDFTDAGDCVDENFRPNLKLQVIEVANKWNWRKTEERLLAAQKNLSSSSTILSAIIMIGLQNTLLFEWKAVQSL